MAVARQTCPATTDGRTPYQHGTDASGNSQCGVKAANGDRFNCVYSKSPSIRGGLVYDSACGTCQKQMIGADPYNSYNDNVARQYRSGALGNFFVCPATDTRKGSALNQQYVDPSVGPNGGINCNYRTPEVRNTLHHLLRVPTDSVVSVDMYRATRRPVFMIATPVYCSETTKRPSQISSATRTLLKRRAPIL